MKILLVCAAGMSTSLLVKKMEKEAQNRNLDVTIAAKPIDELENVIDNYDIILLGPQIKYKEVYVKELVKDRGKVYAVIPPMMYGMVDGNGALDMALKLSSN
ncbi:cytochrome c biogenesis protein [Thermoanaerobacterium thermosaccharolyticum]|uniref:Cytochrome c biogenesis protein n=1 Tax=Thermoanaerobacterium thermosaccharolyticum TaxID=1517 RepID=A0A223HX49_THETR|nr:PTS sugar transporter subunit IIB [Thermoanaerobacterium thermosaccharolyticum]AST57012.1 cytochrome c biogenesis protein [Thermoanaerobacterium thermosaccharolyticum]WHE06854.1 PTS sugar transporter subunit IIB [Thermoanaerobacterium thermosaccharolyticum]